MHAQGCGRKWPISKNLETFPAICPLLQAERLLYGRYEQHLLPGKAGGFCGGKRSPVTGKIKVRRPVTLHSREHLGEAQQRKMQYCTATHPPSANTSVPRGVGGLAHCNVNFINYYSPPSVSNSYLSLKTRIQQSSSGIILWHSEER